MADIYFELGHDHILRVKAEVDDFTHRTFIDLKLLQRSGSVARQRQRSYLERIRQYVLAFVDETLRNEHSSDLIGGVVDSLITVDRFGPLGVRHGAHTALRLEEPVRAKLVDTALGARLVNRGFEPLTVGGGADVCDASPAHRAASKASR